MRPSLSPFWCYALCWCTLAKWHNVLDVLLLPTCILWHVFLDCAGYHNARLQVIFCLTLILSFVSIFLSPLRSWASYPSCSFYWHFEFSVMSAELDCHPSARSLALDWVDLELGLNNVPRFNSKSASLLSPFWSFFIVPCISILFSSVRKQIWFCSFHSATDTLMYLVP